MFGVWPENYRAVRLFYALGTQWRVLAGPTAVIWLGLDYGALDAVESRIPATAGISDPDRATVFAQLRAMEREALDVLRNRS